jgi:serine/threonine protein kinase
MLDLPGYYIFEKIYESANSRVYRGVRSQDNLPVILKVLKKEYPSLAEITRYKLEYEIMRRLNLEGVVKAYDFQQYRSTFVIALEDFGGESLENLMASKSLSLSEFLQIAIAIAQNLSEIHTAHIIHKDINPANIVFNPDTGELKIIDFGISSDLLSENISLQHPNVIEGTLGYISPEQTGRMNCPIDYRTDFYSLGATFYHLLTQQLPFSAVDAMELIHFHLAKESIAPQILKSEIPQAISEIILKLLAKLPSDRYQTAAGIVADLKICWEGLETQGEITNFPLAKQDISGQLQISHKLYGREREVKALL